MNTQMLQRARRNFDRPDIERHLVRHNIRAWVRSVRILGDKWLLANHITRLETK